MSRHDRFPRLFPALALAAVVCAVAAASAAAGLVIVHPKGLPLSVGLPSGWQVTTTTPGSRFDAASGASRLDVTSATFTAPFSYFVKSETAAARQHYHSEDPKASVSSHVVSLPSGPAVLTTVMISRGSPLAIYVYGLLHNGVTYHFTYFTAQSQAKSQRPGFQSSASSITFSKVGAAAK
jgi:hypothetical protein